jgi:hypothetical protein
LNSRKASLTVSKPRSKPVGFQALEVEPRDLLRIRPHGAAWSSFTSWVITGTTADRPELKKLMKAVASGDVVITPAVDRPSRDTTDLLVIARDMQRAGARIRSLAEPFLDTTSDFAGIIFAILGVAAKLGRRRILERTARPDRRHEKGRQIRPQAQAHTASTARGDQAARRGRGNAAIHRPQPQCQRADDFETVTAPTPYICTLPTCS